MALRVQVFQHVPFEGLGSMESVLSSFGASIAYTRFFEGDLSPAIDAFDFLIVMGGPMGVYDEAEFSWLREEKRALKEALVSGKPVLGICLGSQLMAEVLGGVVTKNPSKEIGWLPVERLPEASSSWVTGIFPERFTTFHWHGDTFSIPPEATSLFRSEGCAHQGFVWGEKAVALQFHPEITPETTVSWVKHGAEELTPGPYVQTPEEIRGKPEDFEANNIWIARLCDELIRRV